MDEQLKRRLVGAGIIVVLAVIVVPMFFEDKTRGSHDQSALPEPMEERALALPKDVAGPSSQATGPAAAPAAGQDTAPAPARNRKFEVVPLVDAPPKPAQPAPEPVAEPAGGLPEAPAATEAMDEEAPPGANPPPATGTSGPAAVKAKPARTTSTRKPSTSSAAAPQAPASAKPKPTAEAQKRTTTGSKTQPAAGKAKTPASTAKTATPPPPKAAPTANKTVAPEKKGAGTAPPAKPKAATPRSDAGGGGNWTVQAGTFVEETNARTLAEKLKQRNLPVRVQTAEGASGKVYRVTVGPNLDRTKAEKIQKQLAAQDDVQGMILQTR